MSRDKNTGPCDCIKSDSSYFERVIEFKYLGTTLTDQNSIPEEIKSILKSGNASFHSVLNVLSSSLLTKNIKIMIHRTVIFLLFCMSVSLDPSHRRRNIS